MKANLYLIALAILLLPLIYFLNDEQNHWSQLFPLGYLIYSFIVGTISFLKNKDDLYN